MRATSHWQEDGYDAVKKALCAHGAIIIVFWHERLFASPFCFNTRAAEGRSLHAPSRLGRVGGAVLQRFGFLTVIMPKGRRAARAARHVLTGLENGVSIGLAVDGPRGPARIAHSYPLQWARA
ncbi:MAG: DUF374 domain-containing protein, partial [Pseudomonadota bacterium]